jgi:GT2 family glycosyltransferase
VTERRPTVSVIIVNYKGAADTAACLDACRSLDWPEDQLELIVVDNASRDNSAQLLRDQFPGVRLIESKKNLGFAGGCNYGAVHATGEYLAFLNNDAKPHPQWVRSAVELLERDNTVACVASKVLDWEGRIVDFVDAAMSFYGHGFKLHSEKPDSEAYNVEKDVLFASGAAMFVRTDLFRAVDGFDERYFMFFEDVDFGWRLWLLGHTIRFLPSSLVYHRHHASMRSYGVWNEQYLLERNALYTIYKNYERENLAPALAAAIPLAIHRGVVLGETDTTALDMSRSGGNDGLEELSVSKQTMASVYAIDEFLESLPGLTVTRTALQAARQRTDRDIMQLFHLPFEPNCRGDFPYLFDAVVDAMELRERLGGQRRVLVVTGDSLTPKMAGPAIRAWEIAQALSHEHEVELVSLQRCDISHDRFRARRATEAMMHELEEWCDIIIFQGFLLTVHPFLRESQKTLVVDIYDPFHLEQLEQARDLGEETRREVIKGSTGVLNDQLNRGDFFLCASSKQRDFWLGQLAGLGRINPQTYDEDETLESLITVVPFGLSDTRPVHTEPALKGVVPGIGPDDKVILWGGGVYNWFDPLTLLRAVDRLRHRRPDVRLFFLGLRHPNPDVPEMRMAVDMRELSDELGLTGIHVFFNEGWVPYDERQNYLLEADVAVSTHLDHVETAFSFRTRILDYLWAGVPIVATGGDGLADLIESKGLGVAVPPGDVAALEDALFRVIDDEEFAALCRKNIAAVAPQFRWSEVLAPLLEFCRAPRRAPDLVGRTAGELAPALRGRAPALRVQRPGESRLRAEFALARSYLQQGGAGLVARRVAGRIAKYFIGPKRAARLFR